MAERTPESGSQDTSAADQQAAEDLTILFPNQTIPIGGQQVTVQEYAFMQWLELKPLCTEITQQFADYVRDEKNVDVDEILECFENNFKTMQALLCASTATSVEFLKKLKSDEMEVLLFTWWGVNKHFFIRSAQRIVRAQKKLEPDGQTSSSA